MRVRRELAFDLMNITKPWRFFQSGVHLEIADTGQKHVHQVGDIAGELQRDWFTAFHVCGHALGSAR
jgi:hypothetical protein